MSQRHIKQAKFQSCTREECAFSEKWHLMVSEQVVELQKGNGIAISYTWGEFNRRDITIGHLDNGSPVTMCLGEEWNTDDFAATLRNLCVDSAGCWIDQICIPQNDEDIRSMLAAIPEIYKTLDVIILLPSAPCACFDQLADMAAQRTEKLAAEKDGMDEVEFRKIDREGSSELRTTQLKCWNSLPCTSWFSRLWTRQELQYATDIRVIYATAEPAPCFHRDQQDPQSSSLLDNDDDLHLLQPFLRLAFQTAFKAEDSRILALKDMDNRIMRTSRAGLQAVSDYMGASGQCSGWSNFCNFFAGAKLPRDRSVEAFDRDDSTKVDSFMAKLTRLGANRRVATQERDYVVAVWVDCPGYTLPDKYKKMSLVDLLEDALEQLIKNFGASPIVTAPSGIFTDCSEGSGLWTPSTNIRDGSIEDSASIYGVLPTNTFIVPRGKGFELDRWITGTAAHSKVAEPFQQAFQGASTADVFETLANIAVSWTSDSSTGLALKEAWYSDEMATDSLTDDPKIKFRKALTDCMDSGKVVHSWSDPDFDHYPVIYRMVTDMLRLDYDMCRKAELVLMVSLQASCIGLLRGSSVETTQNNVTILMGVIAQGCVAYEAERVEDHGEDSVPSFRVCGVWVPTRALALLNIDFLQQPQGKQGFVV